MNCFESYLDGIVDKELLIFGKLGLNLLCLIFFQFKLSHWVLGVLDIKHAIWLINLWCVFYVAILFETTHKHTTSVGGVLTVFKWTGLRALLVWWLPFRKDGTRRCLCIFTPSLILAQGLLLNPWKSAPFIEALLKVTGSVVKD